MKNENKKNLAIYLTLVIMSFALLSIAPKASAATDPADIKYVPLAPIEGTVDASGTTNLGTYLTGMFKVGVAAAGALAFLMIVWGGFTYLSTDAITGKEEGKERITRALGGLVLALAAYIILNTIGGSSLVNLNLNFGTAAKPGTDMSAPSEYQSLVDIQLAQLKASSEQQDKARIAEVDRLKTSAETLRKNAATLPDGPNKTALLAEADKITLQAEELNLQRVAAIQERLASETTLNAYTPEKLAAAIADAGTSVQKIQAAYAEARSTLASNPARVAALSTEEMDRISVIRKSTAFGILENPPLNDPTNSRADVSDESGKVLSGYVNREALNAQIDAQIAQILAEQLKQKALLENLNSSTPGSAITADVAARIAKNDATAKAQICQIKNACKNADYGCDTLRPNIVCAY